MRILVAAVAVLGLSAPALAGNGQPGALDRCTRLLPEVKDYTFKVSGTARHDGNQTTVKHTVLIEGTRTVVLPKEVQPSTDSKADAEAFGREIEAFQKCLEKTL